MHWIRNLIVVLAVFRLSLAGILHGGQPDAHNEDEWDGVYRVYSGDDWDSHDDYISKERSARFGDSDDSQFRSWKLDQWDFEKIQKVKVQVFDDGDEVMEFEFDGDRQNLTSFFDFKNLRKSSFVDIPDAPDGKRILPFDGDDFSFDGDDDARHWAVSGRHVGNCRDDDGWFQVLDKPKPGRDRCVCGYENVNKYPTIMYAKGNRKTRWSNKHNVGHADMMQISVSKKPYPKATAPVPPPVIYAQPVPQPQPRPRYPQHMYTFETKK